MGSRVVQESRGRCCTPRKRRSRFPAVCVLAVLVTFLAAALTALASPPCLAQNYSFEVPDMGVRVVVNKDSSIDFYYEIYFENDPDADPIDIVDIGMPTSSYNPSECEASIDGNELTPGQDIRNSEYVSNAVEVDLGDWAIPPGETGVLEFHGSAPQMAFQDPVHEGYASVKFRSTWFSPDFAHGNTYLNFAMQFPPGVEMNETVYHGQTEPTRSMVEGNIVFTWMNAGAVPYEGYLHGISFPAVYVEGVYPEQPEPDYEPIYTGTTDYSSGSGIFSKMKIWFPIVMVLVIAVFRIFGSAVRVRKKGTKIKYITPAVGVEGAGPMKELSPAEASVVLCHDLDSIAAVAFFEMIKKGLVKLRGTKPLKLERVGVTPDSVTGYYRDFLAGINKDGSLNGDTLKLALTNLIKGTEKKTTGFPHEETAQYYRDAAEKAWAQVKTQTEHSARMAGFDQNILVLLLDDEFAAKVRSTFGSGSFPLEGWMMGLVNAVAGPQTGVTTTAQGGLSVTGAALSEALAGGFLAVKNGAYEFTDPMEKEIVKDVNPAEYRRVYRPWLYGGRTGGYGGGGGCACACACAGCACACAGGGR